jgi:organic radical activating enzyme
MATDEYKLPINEMFLSPQGEGAWVGTMMWFVRVAGCSVGKLIQGVETWDNGKRTGNKLTDLHAVIPIWQEECTTIDGRKFLCDTDFRVKERLTPNEILERVPDGVKHMCITGGEPLNYTLERLIWQAQQRGITVHIETSGTVPITKAFPNWPEFAIQKEYDEIWVAVSPKFGCLEAMIYRANEIKLLVDENFDSTKLPAAIMNHPLVYVQPINHTFDVDNKHLRLCLDLATVYPTWRISTQMHKIWRVR